MGIEKYGGAAKEGAPITYPSVLKGTSQGVSTTKKPKGRGHWPWHGRERRLKVFPGAVLRQCPVKGWGIPGPTLPA